MSMHSNRPIIGRLFRSERSFSMGAHLKAGSSATATGMALLAVLALITQAHAQWVIQGPPGAVFYGNITISSTRSERQHHPCDYLIIIINALIDYEHSESCQHFFTCFVQCAFRQCEHLLCAEPVAHVCCVQQQLCRELCVLLLLYHSKCARFDDAHMKPVVSNSCWLFLLPADPFPSIPSVTSTVTITYWFNDIASFTVMNTCLNGPSGNAVWKLIMQGVGVGCGSEAVYTDIFGNSNNKWLGVCTAPNAVSSSTTQVITFIGS